MHAFAWLECCAVYSCELSHPQTNVPLTDADNDYDEGTPSDEAFSEPALKLQNGIVETNCKTARSRLGCHTLHVKEIAVISGGFSSTSHRI